MRMAAWCMKKSQKNKGKILNSSLPCVEISVVVTFSENKAEDSSLGRQEMTKCVGSADRPVGEEVKGL